MFIIPNEATAENILTAIDEWAENQPFREDSEAQKLWFVLTALRGPDDDNNDVKYSTTAVIRRNSVPTLAQGAGAIVAPEDRFLDQTVAPISGPHFANHIRTAAESLGL